MLATKAPRLGHKADSIYPHETQQLSKGDILLLLTDGITECEDQDKKQWGNRKLLKTITELKNRDSQSLRSAIIDKVKKHRNRPDYEDDVTLVCMQVNE